MKQLLLFTIFTLLLFIFYSCSTTKTTKVYIEVGVNDYTKTNTSIPGKSKKLNSGNTTYHAVDTAKQLQHTKTPH